MLSWIQPQTGNNNKADKPDFMKMNNSEILKDTVNRVKRQPTEQKKTFAYHLNKGLISRLYTEIPKLNNNSKSIQKTYNPIKKCTKDVNGHFSKENNMND